MKEGKKILFLVLAAAFSVIAAMPLHAQPDGPHNHFNGGYMWQKLTPSGLTKADGGTYRILVIPARYSDVSFFYTKENIVNMLTGDNYTAYGAEGSARKYLEDQLGAAVEIVVTDIVAVSMERAYYGKNNESGNDMHAGTFIAEACTAADPYVNFRDFDSDGDGRVDNVFVLFAGEDEAQCMGEHPEYMWSHSYNLLNSDYGQELMLDGVSVNNYACTSEIYRKYASSGSFDPVMAPIGTFCHEYLHNFGVADLYDTDYALSGGTAAGVWGVTSLMSAGNYNNNGNTPANLSSIERECLGIGKPVELGSGDYVMHPVGDKDYCSYALYNPADRNEYYLFEMRSNSGWDRYIGISEETGAGMLVYHIDKRSDLTSESERFGDVSSSDRWTKYNEVNANPKHQCADLVEADARVDVNPTESSKNNIEGIYFPAYGATSIGGDSKIKLKFWDDTESDYALRNIRIEDGTVKFTCVNLYSPIPVVPTEPPADDAMIYIIVLSSDDGVLELRASNDVGAVASWYYDGAEIADPKSFRPLASGEIRLELLWPDGSVDYVFKKHTVE